ncbi:MAG: ATP-binding protein, partial [Candidatus Sericytochromatia bacterium]
MTVLFADVVRSMDIAAAVGTERLREIMGNLVKRSTVVVKRYGGTVDKFTGDGIMAVFGAPVALEDHAVRACFAALGIQDQARQLAAELRRDGIAFEMRVGLNSGQVIAGDITSETAGYTAVGEHVGLAQRMESVAPPGGVMLSESTARLAKHAAVLGEPETVRIKGAADPMPAHRLQGMESAHAMVGRGESRLVGRRWEMAAVEGILDRSIENDGAVVALVGPAGIGKSRIVREIAATATERGVDVFWAFCESHASDIPFHVVGQLLRAVVGLPILDEGTVRERLKAGFDGADAQDVVLFEDLLGIRDPETALPTIDPDAVRRRLSALVKGATISRAEPAMYIIEDAHWIDDVSDSMLADFMTVIPQTHSMVLVTHRPEFRGAITRVPGAQSLMLAPLNNSESTELATDLLGSDPSVGELTTTIAERAAGNPFFAEEMVRDLVERGVLDGERGAYTCEVDVAEVDVPVTLQATISARIDRLKATAKRALCAAAVIGMRFDTGLLATMGIDAVPEDLLQAELVDQVSFTGHPEYAFRHPLIRTVAYESQLRSDRAKSHRRLAAAIESQEASTDENAALIADHLEAAGDLRAAYAWRMRAATWSQSRDIAAAHVSWERARNIADALADDEPDRLAMRIAPRTLMCANGFRIHAPITGARFDELQVLCTVADDKASVAIAMAGVVGDHMVSGRVREAAQCSAEVTSLLEAIGDPTLTVELMITPMSMAMTTGNFAELLRLSELVIRAAPTDHSKSGLLFSSPLAFAHGARSVARWAHGLDGWRPDLRRAVDLGRSTDPMSKGVMFAITYGMAIGNDVVVPDESAMQDLQGGLDAAERSADDLAVAFSVFTMGLVLVSRKATETERGLGMLRQSREMAASDRFYRSHIPLIDVWIGHALAGQGDHEGALPLLRAGVAQLFDEGQFGYCDAATRFLVYELLFDGTDVQVREAEAAVERLAAVHVLEGLAIHEIALLELHAHLARRRGDPLSYRKLRDAYLDRATALGFEGHV